MKQQKKIKKLIEASSIKSMESARSETERMFNAAINSIKKYSKFKTATNNTAFLKDLKNFTL